MKFSSLPVVQFPLINVSTDPLDLLILGLVLRMKQLAKTNPKFVEMVHDRKFRIQISTEQGMARQIVIDHGKVDTVQGAAENADFSLQFVNSDQGVKALTKGSPKVFMIGMQEGTIKMEGDFGLLVWFNQAAKMIPPKLPKAIKEKVKAIRQFFN